MKNVTAKIISVVFAVFLWFQVTTNASFTHKVSVPIRYIGPDEGYVLASEKPEKAIVAIRGTGRDLLSFTLSGIGNTLQRYALVVLSGRSKGKQVITIDKGDIHLSVGGTLQVEEILQPADAVITIELDREVTRSVPIQLDSLSNYIIERNYIIMGKPTANPHTVNLEGPHDIVSIITSLSITSLEGETISPKNSVVSVRLEVPQFVKADTDTVAISFPIEPLISRQLSGIPVTLKGFPRKRRPSFKPDSVLVRIEGPKSVISVLEPGSIRVEVDYKKFREHIAREETFIKPTLLYPDGIKKISIIPEAIEFHVQSK